MNPARRSHDAGGNVASLSSRVPGLLISLAQATKRVPLDGNPRVHLDVFRGDFEIVSGPGQALYVAFGVNRLPIRIGYSVFNRDRLVTQHAAKGTCRGLHGW